MHRSTALLLMSLLILTTLVNAGPEKIADYRWKKRVVLVFGEVPDVEKQLKLWNSETPGFEERDIVIEKISGSEPLARKIREQFQIAPGAFAVLLIGKDGGEKFRNNSPIAASRLFSEVDSMPMRRQEMRDVR